MEPPTGATTAPNAALARGLFFRPKAREEATSRAVQASVMMVMTRTNPEVDSSEESELVARAQRGAHDAFESIVSRYADRLFFVVQKIVRDPNDAEEVVQETFLKAFRNLVSFQADSALYTWLYRIAVNAAVDHSKKERRRRHLSLDDEDQGLDGAVPGDSPSPSEGSERGELVELVREGIESLPERYRIILNLREYSDLSYEQLAVVLELPKGTVESRLFRARMKLRDWLVRKWGVQGLDPESFGF